MSSIDSVKDGRYEIRRFFDSIAFRYDFLNHFLSFQLDEIWRRKACDCILQGHERTLLDLGVGTGKFLKLFLKRQSWDYAVGLDFAPAMLELARRELGGPAKFLGGDFHHLPFKENSFDLVVSSFTLRSVQDMPAFLKEVYGILSGGGQAGFLCLTRPQNPFFRLLYVPYLKFYLPLIGRLFSGNTKAYQFLSHSILSFQEPARTEAMMREIGFTETHVRPFSLGMVTLITGRKPSPRN